MTKQLLLLLLVLTCLLRIDLQAQPKSVPELLDIALSNNPETQRAWWSAQQAVAQRQLARSAYYPTLELKNYVTHARDYKFPTGDEATYTTYSTDLVLNFLLLDFGERSANNQAAIAALQAAQWQTDFALQRVLHTVLENTYAYLDAQELVQTRQQILDEAKTTLELADELYRAGLRSVNDVYALRTTISEMQVDLALQKAARDIARGRLATNLGLCIDEPLEVQPLLDPATQATLQEGLPQLIEKAQQVRADLLAKRAEVDQKNALYASSRFKHLPKLRFNASGGYQRYEHDKANGANYNVGLTFDIPLFNGFETIYQNQVAYADARATEADLEKLELDIALDVMTSSRNFQAAQEILQIDQESMLNATKTFEGVLEKYKAGTQSIFDLTTAQKQLAEVRIRHGEAKIRWYRALAQLAYATGTMMSFSEEDPCAVTQ